MVIRPDKEYVKIIFLLLTGTYQIPEAYSP